MVVWSELRAEGQETGQKGKHREEGEIPEGLAGLCQVVIYT